MKPKPITETKNKKLLAQWRKRARMMTLDTLPAFLKELTSNYDHDYGTICHAVAAAAVGAASAVDHSPTGGITGFQSSCIMWEFCRQWMQWGDEPRRLQDQSNMLFPQYEEQFTTISKSTWAWLKKEAAKRLKNKVIMDKRVYDHMKSIVAGTVPFGYKVSNK